MVEKTLNFIVPGGQATGGPPIGPALGPLGINIMNVVNKINEETEEYDGTPVPVDVTIDTDTREFTVKVGTLSTFALITQKLGVEKGSSIPNQDYVGDLEFEELVDIAKRKWDDLYSTSLKTAVKEVLGTCQSMGVTVEGRAAKEVQDLISMGEYDHQLTHEA
ncbi:MAG: 50S ribosomal protein L11 [Candidatus Bathyarchaeia archaeon]